MPMATTGSENLASSAAMMMSHGHARSRPPAMHTPWIEAIDSFGLFRHFIEYPT
jgi:hypothetical protein